MSRPTRLDISPEELRHLLAMNPDYGTLIWKPRSIDLFSGQVRPCRSWNAKFSHKEAFTATNSHGYKVGTLFGKIYTGHRVVWCIAFGEWPKSQVDHINGVRTDNKLSNLRLCSNSENHKNQKMPRTNTSGCVGVFLEPRTGSWTAEIYDQGKRFALGTFIEKEQAIAARKAAEKSFGYHPNHGR